MIMLPETNAGYFDGADVPEEFDPFASDLSLLVTIFGGYIPREFYE